MFSYRDSIMPRTFKRPWLC